jgi:hypothetical protein
VSGPARPAALGRRPLPNSSAIHPALFTREFYVQEELQMVKIGLCLTTCFLPAFER